MCISRCVFRGRTTRGDRPARQGVASMPSRWWLDPPGCFTLGCRSGCWGGLVTTLGAPALSFYKLPKMPFVPVYAPSSPGRFVPVRPRHGRWSFPLGLACQSLPWVLQHARCFLSAAPPRRAGYGLRRFKHTPAHVGRASCAEGYLNRSHREPHCPGTALCRRLSPPTSVHKARLAPFLLNQPMQNTT